VLAGVNLRIERGEVVAIVGSTGSGKSTLCTLLAGLVTPTAGQVRVNGRPMAQLDPVERTKAVALVFQESFLFADTVAANVDLSGQATEAEIWAALSVAQADRLVDELPAGLQTVLGERGVTLSGGQRQRVALARALLRQPRLLLLDDATSAVDAVVEQQILARLRTDLVTTTVIVAQRVSTIELADRVLYLDGGRIAAAGTHHELLAHPGYEALVRAYEDMAR
jgi:ABC-type multidrug transport system fused ATPase/permease subunit